MKKLVFAALMLIGLNFASMAQTTPVKKVAAKTEAMQSTDKKAPEKKAPKKHKKHHKKHAAAAIKKEETKTK